MNYDEGVVFEICCNNECTTWDGAYTALHEYCRQLPDGDAASALATLAAHAIQAYATLALPTPRQQILRLCRDYAPELLETLPLKLDGASPAHVLEVLAAMEKKYGLFIGPDVSTTVDVMEHVLSQNRMLQVENEELRDQLLEQDEGFAEEMHRFVTVHDAIARQLYEALAALKQSEEERTFLRSQVPVLAEAAQASHSPGRSSPGRDARVMEPADPATASAALKAEVVALRWALRQKEADISVVRLQHQQQLRDLQNAAHEAEQQTLQMLTEARGAVERARVARPFRATATSAVQCDLIAPHEPHPSVIGDAADQCHPAQLADSSPRPATPEPDAKMIDVETAQRMSLLREQNAALRQRLASAAALLGDFQGIALAAAGCAAPTAQVLPVQLPSPSAVVREQHLKAALAADEKRARTLELEAKAHAHRDFEFLFGLSSQGPPPYSSAKQKRTPTRSAVGASRNLGFAPLWSGEELRTIQGSARRSATPVNTGITPRSARSQRSCGGV